MSSTSAPFGMRPSFHPTGLERAAPYTIGTGYASAIYKGSPVILNTDGTINIGTTNADIIGVFDGVEYTDSTGKPTLSNFWPASTTATNITAWVWDVPNITYDIQSSGSIAATAVGDQADFVNPSAGSTSTGLSTAAINSTLKGAGVQGQLRIVGLTPAVDNAWGDTYTVVQVQIARHQYVSNKTAI
jgi:hypothetical protein